MGSFAENMAAAKKNQEEGGNFKSLPLGSYTCFLQKAFRKDSKAGNAQVNMDWVVAEPAPEVEVGTRERQWHRLEGNRVDVSISIMLQEFQMMGVDAGELTEYEQLDLVLEELTQKHPMVKLVIAQTQSKGKTYINRKVEVYLGDYDGGLIEADVDTFAPQGATPPIPEQPSSSTELVVGNKFKYKVGTMEFSGVIINLYPDTGKLDFPMHKGVSLDALVGAA